MATTLVSPGVEVSVTDESQYLPAATNSVPLVVLATASNKTSGSGTGIAAGTLESTANQLYLATSQRALAAHYGVPYFYRTANGTPINGYELNEYGLLAAYSALGVTNQCYVLRADIDLSALTASLTRPVGNPNNGSFWLDTTNTKWGLFQWNQDTSEFTAISPLVITDSVNLQTPYSYPSSSFGSIGQYAVNALNANNPMYYKRSGPTSAQTNDAGLVSLYNTWVQVGSAQWQTSWPVTQATNTPATLNAGDTFIINGVTITVPAASSNHWNTNTVAGVAGAITIASSNNALPGVHAAVINGALTLYANSTAGGNGTITIASGVGAVLTTLGLTAGVYSAPAFQASPSYTVPQWNSFNANGGAPSGSVWQKTSAVNAGANISIKKYSSTVGNFIAQTCSVYANDAVALYALDATGGGVNIPATATYAQSSPMNDGTASLMILERYALGATVVTGSVMNPTFVSGNQFTIASTQPGTATLTAPVTVTLAGTTAHDFISAVSSANISYVSASVNGSGALVFTHSAGGDIILNNIAGTPVTTAGFTARTSNSGTYLVRSNYINGIVHGVILSNWIATPTFSYTAAHSAPYQDPASGTYWYYSDATQPDILISNNGIWEGYQNVTLDARGYNLSQCNAAGPIVSASAPTTHTDAATSPLVYGDLWVDTADLENYPMIYRWQAVSGVDQWVAINNTDSTTSSGIIFQDARWASTGSVDPVNDALPTIQSLLTSNYLDQDAPNAELYPNGILLWNTRRSGYNVKTYQSNYFNNSSFPTYDWSSTTSYTVGQYVQFDSVVYACIEGNTNQQPDESASYWAVQEYTGTWVSATGSRPDGSPYMGRQSQRALIVDALKAAISTNTSIREENTIYNLIAVPGYPELGPDMAALNDDIGNLAFALVDTPLRLIPDDVATWATNNNGAGLPTADGLETNNSYAAAFYPSCTTNDLSGNTVVTAASHMMIRTIIRSDEIAYPWLAPAGTRRGVIDNANTIGYINPITGLFISIGVGHGLRDVLYQHQINPITYIPGTGITNFGNKTLQGTASAMDRINVARLVAYIRARLNTIGKQYLFEPNDTITRTEISNSITSLMIDLVAKRGLYDYLVVCDTTNNTPATIDANQLWVDIAIEPVKAVEFIYIPVRIENTGGIAALGAA